MQSTLYFTNWQPNRVSLGGFSVILSSHGICSIPTTRYWCRQNTEILWLLGIPNIPRLRWTPPNHKNRGRYKTPDTATLESGCLLFGPRTIHYRGAACCNPILVSLPVNYQGLRSFADAGQVRACSFPYQVRGFAGIDREILFFFSKFWGWNSVRQSCWI